MELRPALNDAIRRLLDKGVTLCNPLSLDIGDEVDTDRISGDGVKVYPGCRIYGEKTVIAAGAQIGREGPATIENCQIGPRVELKGGYFRESVFLQQANLGLGAQVREACILEEEAGGAHCVGLKQTILFPFVTLGSLVNFCDGLMAGGTSRKQHSEVGSSYIHFNFTPDGDKTTASLLGDVPRGVMLNQPPIFLGGQGGMVGPLRMGFGNVVAAGSILRKDVLADGRLVFAGAASGGTGGTGKTGRHVPGAYPGLARIVRNNFIYLASLAALEQWYVHVRQSFFREQEFGDLIFQGALEKLAMATEERCGRLEEMGRKLAASGEAGRRELAENAAGIRDLLAGKAAGQSGARHKDLFLEGLRKSRQGAGYIDAIRRLPEDTARAGTEWLDQVVGETFRLLAARIPALALIPDTAQAAARTGKA